MKSYKNNFGVLGIVLIAALLCQCKRQHDTVSRSRVNALPYYNDPSFTPKWISAGNDSIRGMHAIPNFNLVNQHGDTITEEVFHNKIYVTDFFFTSCPGICPKMTNNMALIQEAYKNDDEVLLLSHSVTPVYDSVPVLRNYADAKGILPGKWHLVTGTRKDIYNLGRFAYFVEEDLGIAKSEDEFLHTENFVLVDKQKHIRGIYNGLNKTAIHQLIADIKTLKTE